MNAVSVTCVAYAFGLAWREHVPPTQGASVCAGMCTTGTFAHLNKFRDPVWRHVRSAPCLPSLQAAAGVTTKVLVPRKRPRNSASQECVRPGP